MELVYRSMTSKQKIMFDRYLKMIIISLVMHLVLLLMILFFPSLGHHKPVVRPKYSVSLVSLPENLTARLPAAPAKTEQKTEPQAKPVKKEPPKPKKSIPVPKKDNKPKVEKKDEVPVIVTTPPPETKVEEPASDEDTFSMSSSNEGVQRSGAMTIDSANFPFLYYLQIVRDKISRNWFPPLSVIVPGEKKSIIIYFRIAQNGTVFAADIEESSGNSLLDQSALRSVLVSNPFPPLPFGYSENDLGIHFRFICFR